MTSAARRIAPPPQPAGPPPARLLFVLHPDAVLRERVHRAAGERFECVTVPGWESLARFLHEAPLTSLAVVDPYAEMPGRRDLAPQLRTLLSRFPAVTVLAALEIHPQRFHDLRTLGEWGVSEVIALDRDETTESIARKIRSMQGRLTRSFLAHALPSFVAGRGRAVLAAAAEIATDGGQGADLAQALSLTDRALLRWCERSHLPPPRRLLAWIRVLLAAELLDYPEETVLEVAHTCGYATDSSLRRAVYECTGATPTELRRTGAFATAADAFLSELLRLREAAGSPPPRAAGAPSDDEDAD
jgi:AraC-like DNA-binding protein